MGSGGVAIAALPTVICLKVPFSDGLGGAFGFIVYCLFIFCSKPPRSSSRHSSEERRFRHREEYYLQSA